jgi:hypothetical protein
MKWRRKRSAQDFAEEIQAHLELEQSEMEREGLARDAARGAARRAFGNVMAAGERFHEAADGLGGTTCSKTSDTRYVGCGERRGFRFPRSSFWRSRSERRWSRLA